MTTETTPADAGATAAAPVGEVETPATQPDSTQNVETTAETAAAPAKSKTPPGVQKRFDEMTAQTYALKRENERLAQMLEASISSKTQPAAPEPVGAPTLEQFEFDNEKYVRACVAYELKLAREAEAKQKEAETAKEVVAKRARTFAEREAAYAEKNEGYTLAATLSNDPTFPVSQTMAEAIFESEEGPELLHYLNQHRDEAAKISQMSGPVAAIALGKIAARIAMPPPEPKPIQVSAAPPPAPVVRATAPQVKGLSDDLPWKEWVKVRERGLAKKHGG